MATCIRQATANDFDDVYRFLCELQQRQFDATVLRELYLKNIANPNNIYLVACEGNTIIGYISCHLQTLLHHAGKVAEVQEMYLISEKRSRGIGKLMMNEVKALARSKGAVQLEVTTRAIREKAIHFYEREAFENSHKKLVHYFHKP